MPLQLTAGEKATDVLTQKKIFESRMIKLVISNDEINDDMK